MACQPRPLSILSPKVLSPKSKTPVAQLFKKIEPIELINKVKVIRDNRFLPLTISGQTGPKMSGIVSKTSKQAAVTNQKKRVQQKQTKGLRLHLNDLVTVKTNERIPTEEIFNAITEPRNEPVIKRPPRPKIAPTKRAESVFVSRQQVRPPYIPLIDIDHIDRMKVLSG